MRTCKWSGILIVILGCSWNRPLLATLGLVVLGVALFISYQQRSLEGAVHQDRAAGE